MPIADFHVSQALRTFVSGANPVLDAVGRAGSLLATSDSEDEGRLARLLEQSRRAFGSVVAPGTTAWEQSSVEQRCAWWAGRIGELVALPIAAPQTLGPLAERYPVQATITLAGRALVVCAVARECGTATVDEQVAILARQVLGRDLVRAEPEPTASAPQVLQPGGGVLGTIQTMLDLGLTLRSSLSDIGSEVERLAPARKTRLSDRLLLVAVIREVKTQQTQLRATAADALRAHAPQPG
jgi:hypothetical protein